MSSVIEEEAACAAYFAEDLLEYYLRSCGILWKAPRPAHRQKEYLDLPVQLRFNENIGHAMLLVHSLDEFRFNHASNFLWENIAKRPERSFFVYKDFMKKGFTELRLSLDNLLFIFAVVASSCVHACQSGLFLVLKPASLSIRNALMSYTNPPSEIIKALQIKASEMVMVG